MQPSLLVFADLDGTILDHDSYCAAPARPAIDELERRGVPWILATSKTWAEVVEIRSRLGNRHPSILENGGAVGVPAGYFDSDDGERVFPFGVPYERIRQILLRLRSDGGFRFEGFGDMSAERLVTLTGLSIRDAGRARRRMSSEPLLWLGTERARTQFQRRLSAEGLRLTRGGRFWHVHGGVDKATGLQWLRARYQRSAPSVRFTTVAAGDAANDREMLEAVDLPIIVPPRYGERLRIRDGGRAIRPDRAGPAGFRAGIETALERINGTEGAAHG